MIRYICSYAHNSTPFLFVVLKEIEKARSQYKEKILTAGYERRTYLIVVIAWSCRNLLPAQR